MIEVLKQMVEALESPNAGLVAYEGEWRSIQSIAIQAGKQAIAELERQEPVAWQLWVGADTPLNAPMGWQFYSTYDSLKSAEVSARTINSYQQAPFAKLVPLYTAPPQRTEDNT